MLISTFDLLEQIFWIIDSLIIGFRRAKVYQSVMRLRYRYKYTCPAYINLVSKYEYPRGGGGGGRGG